MKTLKAGLTYFALVFGTGFLLGAIRTTWVVPRLGQRTAELIEAPIMLVVIILAARFAVRRLAMPAAASSRLGMGLIALALLVLAELAVALGLEGSIARYLATRDPVAGAVYLVMLGIFSVMPLLVRR